MLVLSRRTHERIFIGDSIIISVERIQDGQVRLGFVVPRDVLVLREELVASPAAGRDTGDAGREGGES